MTGSTTKDRVLDLLATPGPEGPVAWTVAELVRGIDAHPTTVARALEDLCHLRLVRPCGVVEAPGRRGAARSRLWKVTARGVGVVREIEEVHGAP